MKKIIILLLIFITSIGNTFATYGLNNLGSEQKKEFLDFKIKIKNKELNWFILYSLFDKILEKKYSYNNLNNVKDLEKQYKKRINFLLKIEKLFKNKLYDKGIIKYYGKDNYKNKIKAFFDIQENILNKYYNNILLELKNDNIGNYNFKTREGQKKFLDYFIKNLDKYEKYSKIKKYRLYNLVYKKYGNTTLSFNGKKIKLLKYYKAIDGFLLLKYNFNNNSEDNYEKRLELLKIFGIFPDFNFKLHMNGDTNSELLEVLKDEYIKEYRKLIKQNSKNQPFYIKNKKKIDELNKKYGFIYNPLMTYDVEYLNNFNKGEFIDIYKEVLNKRGDGKLKDYVDKYASVGVDITRIDPYKKYKDGYGKEIQASSMIRVDKQNLNKWTVNDFKNDYGMSNPIYKAPFGELKINSDGYKIVTKALIKNKNNSGNFGNSNIIFDLEKIPGIDYNKAAQFQNGEDAYYMLKKGIKLSGLPYKNKFDDKNLTIVSGIFSRKFNKDEKYKLKRSEYFSNGLYGYIFNR